MTKIIPIVAVSRGLMDRFLKARSGLIQRQTWVKQGSGRKGHYRMQWIDPFTGLPAEKEPEKQFDLFSGPGPDGAPDSEKDRRQAEEMDAADQPAGGGKGGPLIDTIQVSKVLKNQIEFKYGKETYALGSRRDNAIALKTKQPDGKSWYNFGGSMNTYESYGDVCRLAEDLSKKYGKYNGDTERWEFSDPDKPAKTGQKKDDGKYQIYHSSLTGAIDEVIAHLEKQGLFMDEEDIFTYISTGDRKPGEGKTNRYMLPLFDENGTPAKKAVQFQVYGMGNGRYELNMYTTPAKETIYNKNKGQILGTKDAGMAEAIDWAFDNGYVDTDGVVPGEVRGLVEKLKSSGALSEADEKDMIAKEKAIVAKDSDRGDKSQSESSWLVTAMQEGLYHMGGYDVSTRTAENREIARLAAAALNRYIEKAKKPEDAPAKSDNRVMEEELAKYNMENREKVIAEVERVSGKKFGDLSMKDRIRFMDEAQATITKKANEKKTLEAMTSGLKRGDGIKVVKDNGTEVFGKYNGVEKNNDASWLRMTLDNGNVQVIRSDRISSVDAGKPSGEEGKKPFKTGKVSELAGAMQTIGAIKSPYLMHFPSDTWGFVGSVPGELSLEHKDGTLLTDEEYSKVALGGVGLYRSTIQTKVWKTPEEAMNAARALGYDADDLESAQREGLKSSKMSGGVDSVSLRDMWEVLDPGPYSDNIAAYEDAAKKIKESAASWARENKKTGDGMALIKEYMATKGMKKSFMGSFRLGLAKALGKR